MMRLGQRARAALLGAAAILVASSASAESAATLDSVRQHMRAFEYDEAIGVAEAIASDPSAPAALRVEALELCGAIEVLLRHPDQARQAFERLLALDPGHEITDLELPPAVRSFYEEVREGYERQGELALDVVAPETFDGESPVHLTMTIEGEQGGVERALAMVRAEGAAEFHNVEMSCSAARCEAELDPPAVGRGLEYFIRVEAPSGFVLGQLGSEDAPVLVAVEAPVGTETDEDSETIEVTEPRRLWYASWWFWTIVGVVVAGGATTAAVMLTRPEVPPDGTMGSMHMPLDPL